MSCAFNVVPDLRAFNAHENPHDILARTPLIMLVTFLLQSPESSTTTWLKTALGA
jgi:hypothetical protein